ncbi:conjugal transfer protein MobB [Spirosoma knui]
MVIRILTGKDVAGAVRYNEQKVEQQQADRIHVANYPDVSATITSARFRLDLLQQLNRLNPAVQKPCVHLAVAFHPLEKFTPERLREIGNEVMTGAGYGRQPYLMYQHHDTAHPHIHIVTVNVDAKGNRIDDAFIKNRLQQLRRNLEVKHGLIQAEEPVKRRKQNRVGEGVANRQRSTITLSDRIRHMLESYTFGSIDSLKLCLGSQGIRMKTQAGRSGMGITFQAQDDAGKQSRPIRASALDSGFTHRHLSERLTAQSSQHKAGCAVLEAVMKSQLGAFKSLTENHYKQIAQQQGIDVYEKEGSYLYVHTRAGVVAHEKELDQSLSRRVLAQLFAAKTERLAISQQVTGKATTPAASRKRPVKRVADLTNQPVILITGKALVKPSSDYILNKPSLRIENDAGQPAIKLEASGRDRSLKKRRKNRPHL